MDTIFQSWFQFIVTSLVVFVGQVGYALFGFGSGIFSMTILAHFYNDLSNIVILVLLTSIPTEIYVLIKERRSLKTGKILPLIIGLLIGILFGNELLLLRDKINLFPLMGVVIVVFSLYFLFFEERVKPRRIGMFWSFIIGLLSGVTTATFGMGGPPIILYYRFMNPPKDEFRVNVLTIFLITSCIKTPLYIYTGILTIPQVYSSLLVMPFVVLGIWLGCVLNFNIDEARFRKYTSFAMLVLGLMLFFKHN